MHSITMMRILIFLLLTIGPSRLSGVSAECANNENCQVDLNGTSGCKRDEKDGTKNYGIEENLQDGIREIDDYENEYQEDDYEYQEDDYEYQEDDYDYDHDLELGLESQDWDNFNQRQLWLYLGCDDLYVPPLPIHNESTWMLLRGIYHGIVGNEASSISPVSHENGLRIPFIVKQVKGKGRGVFATEHVKKGDLVWTSRQTAQFTSGADFRQFLASVSPGLACDVLQWAYVKDLSLGYERDSLNDEEERETELVISVDFDEGILMNDSVEYEYRNIGCLKDDAALVPGGCLKNLFALRDIAPGEELLCWYGAFTVKSGWDEFGL